MAAECRRASSTNTGSRFNFEQLMDFTNDWNGAEIEQCVASALTTAQLAGRGNRRRPCNRYPEHHPAVASYEGADRPHSWLGVRACGPRVPRCSAGKAERSVSFSSTFMASARQASTKGNTVAESDPFENRSLSDSWGMPHCWRNIGQAFRAGESGRSKPSLPQSRVSVPLVLTRNTPTSVILSRSEQ